MTVGPHNADLYLLLGVLENIRLQLSNDYLPFQIVKKSILLTIKEAEFKVKNLLGDN